jgi:AcrR family transcriptional regulator
MAKRSEATRERILRSAKVLLNRRGFADVSIHEIMAHAGLTHGGFYRHFKSKAELYAEVVAVSYDFAGADSAAAVVAAYLSDRHFGNLDRLCPLIALPSDTARSEARVKEAFEAVFREMVACFERDMHRADAAERALVVASLCIGSMVVARAVEDEALAAKLRDAARAWALRIGGWRATSRAPSQRRAKDLELVDARRRQARPRLHRGGHVQARVARADRNDRVR